MTFLRSLVLTLRPHQWVKNLFVAAPLVFAKRLTDGHALAITVLAVVTFSALSGAVYALNDVLDQEKDRAHPTKRHRPVASGALAARAALWIAAVLALAALASAALLASRFFWVALSYLVLNLAYSLYLKRVAYLDVASIATGFLLRVLGGACAIAVPPSGWLLACTGLLAAFLGFGKRAHELGLIQGEAGKTRPVLEQYDLGHLRLALYALGGATSVAYVFYTRSAHTVAFFGTQQMLLTSPFCVAGIARFLYLVMRRPEGDSPTDEMLKDGPFMANLSLWAVTVLAIIYFL
jgi:4-hydroxybenzoate polyprenyltransferase